MNGYRFLKRLEVIFTFFFLVLYIYILKSGIDEWKWSRIYDLCLYRAFAKLFLWKKKTRRVEQFEKWFEHEGNALEMEIRDYGGYR